MEKKQAQTLGARPVVEEAPDYEAVTHDVRVKVASTFLEERSAPDDRYYVWSYRVRISNEGDKSVRLRKRHWMIIDGLGRRHEISGAGVVGEQPTIEPGETFEYVSGTPLATPSGIMEGRYEMESGEGRRITIDVPAFSLDSPHQSRQLH